jgi:hypothetical protein
MNDPQSIPGLIEAFEALVNSMVQKERDPEEYSAAVAAAKAEILEKTTHPDQLVELTRIAKDRRTIIERMVGEFEKHITAIRQDITDMEPFGEDGTLVLFTGEGWRFFLEKTLRDESHIQSRMVRRCEDKNVTGEDEGKCYAKPEARESLSDVMRAAFREQSYEKKN